MMEVKVRTTKNSVNVEERLWLGFAPTADEAANAVSNYLLMGEPEKIEAAFDEMADYLFIEEGVRLHRTESDDTPSRVYGIIVHTDGAPEEVLLLRDSSREGAVEAVRKYFRSLYS